MRYDISNDDDYIPSCPWVSTIGLSFRPLSDDSVNRRRRTEVTWDSDRQEVVLHCWHNEVTKAELRATLREARQRHGNVLAVVIYCAQDVYAEQFVLFERLKFTRDICRERPDMFCLVCRLEAR